MSECQTHAALVATLETEIVRLRAVNAELRKSIQAPVQPDTKLVQAARQALEALEPIHPGNMTPMAEEAWKTAITALREALEQPQKTNQCGEVCERAKLCATCAQGLKPDQASEPVAWIANEWSVFNTGAEVASGLSLNEAMDYLTDERAARGWSVVCVINKDNMPTRAAPQPAAAGKDDSLRVDALRTLSFCAGLKAGWNFCVSGDDAGFERAKSQSSEALHVLRAERKSPARQQLTDAQIQDIWCSARTEGNQHGPFWFARAIEKAHGIGGEA